MKRNVTRTIKLTALILPVVILLLLIPYNSKIETLRIRGFYKEEPDSLDVVMLGSSEVLADFAPGLAYAEYGFTSYNYGISQNFIDLFQPQMEEIRRHQSPGLIVVDINAAMYVSRNNRYDSIFRTYIEGVPLSENKIRTIREFPYREQPLSYYIPFIMYHGSVSLRDLRVLWGNEWMQYRKDGNVLKGAFTNTGDEFRGEHRDISGDFSEMDMPEENERKLRQFLEYCQQIQDTKILFVSFPHRIVAQDAYDRLRQSNAAAKIIESYGFEYRNLEYLGQEIGLDYRKDFYDDDHMNIYGQKKFTRYLSDLLVNEYGVQPRPQTEENLEKWAESVKYTKLWYAYYEKLKLNDPASNVMLAEEAWLISELDWMERKLEKDGLPLTFESTYAK